MTNDTNQPSTPSDRSNDLDIIFSKFNSDLQKALCDGKFLNYKQKTSLIHLITEYMTKDLHDHSLGTVKNISDQIVNTYPDSFKISIDALDCRDESATLKQHIYNRINYIKKSTVQNKLCLSYDLNDVDEPIEKPKIQDEYGCVAYLPNLPETETWETQEEKRLNLIESWKASKLVNDVTSQLMAETYFLQRKQIHKNKNLSKFFDDWPYFTCSKIIIAHANELLGKDIHKIWTESLKTLSKPINWFSRDNEIIAESKYRKKNKQNQKIPDELTYVRKELKKIKGILQNISK